MKLVHKAQDGAGATGHARELRWESIAAELTGSAGELTARDCRDRWAGKLAPAAGEPPERVLAIIVGSTRTVSDG
eukprot:SAG31_NODE_33890_length_339_cov_0.641667_1_plen_74_part_10